MVYSMQSNRQQPREHTGHARQLLSKPKSAVEPLVLLAPKAPCHVTLREAMMRPSAQCS
eukprot:CAMPEP_0174360104 /NCGR_PEP_ID=MMETSP0811_2-20130205/52262_1 /TAXON_ID=73025 ORGANISM="Eutreptiella gymnastica-like, Strain CCMP1594" /NCGR_SAMPLE_ID=MMETSP0811_2 /ASSEMBLY_ACC=CAM_ASM_000667 /LENGTH=58 /DNA_ID=CAMNT_0015495469 /DNA_START=15 /DNA_END=191 /DNA_ORIENTATION=-